LRSSADESYCTGSVVGGAVVYDKEKKPRPMCRDRRGLSGVEREKRDKGGKSEEKTSHLRLRGGGGFGWGQTAKSTGWGAKMKKR